MLSSLSLGSIDNLESLPINSLNSICDQVRQALLHVYLPRLCLTCQPAFSEAFRKTQSTPLLLKALCDPCKLNYVRDKRSVSRKKPKPERRETITTEDTDSTDNTTATIKFPAKRKQKVPVSKNFQNNLTVKIKLLSATTTTNTTNNNIQSNIGPFSYPLPLTPPPTDDLTSSKPLLSSSELDDITVFIDNTTHVSNLPGIMVPDVPIYEFLSERNVDWCRYCGVAGDTGTFWKLGPWGDRSLCHKHGCEFFGCGFARVTRTRLDLTEFYGEKRTERQHPIISEFCSICWERNTEDSQIISCHGCPLSFHKSCLENTPHNTRNISGHFFCTEKCIDNFEKCLIRPQFPSKANFPFYRQILLLPQEPADATTILEPAIENVKLRINIKQPPQEAALSRKRRKYHRKNQTENQSDRVIAFLPIKVDHSVHHHETIKTPQWTKTSLHERMERLNTSMSISTEAASTSEELNEQLLLDRHARYEHVEKTTRLLKPGVLKQLISGQL